jgi:hypothetical protein
MAAFVTRFPQFVEWPTAALEGRTTVDICVSEPDPFGTVLDELIEGESLLGRSFVARRVDGADGVEGCHLLYISARSNAADELLEAAENEPVLTIGEGPGFLNRGGMIGLRVLDRRVRFEVNADRASAAGLTISSQLLGLALTVRGASPQ